MPPAAIHARIRRAWPGWQPLLKGAFIWALAMTLSAVVGLYIRMEWKTGHLAPLLVIFFLGALFAWPLAVLALRVIGLGNGLPRHFLAFLILTGTTVGVTAGLFALDYWIFRTGWHSTPLTKLWLLQLIISIIAALYQFAVLGLALFLPIGLPASLVATWHVARSRPEGAFPR